VANQQVQVRLKNVNDKKAEKFTTKLGEVVEMRENASTKAEYESAEREISSLIEQVDQIITTLQEDEDFSEQKIERRRKQIGKKTIENVKEEEGLIDSKIFDEYKQLHTNVDKRIREWKSYQFELGNQLAELRKDRLEAIDEERIHTTAAEKISEFMDQRLNEHMELLVDRFTNFRNSLEDKVELMVNQEVAELRERQTRLETKIEVLEERHEQKDSIIESLAKGQHGASNHVQELAEEERGMMQQNDYQSKAEQTTTPESKEESGDLEGTTVDTGETEDEQKDEQESDSTKYRFTGRSLTELKSEFNKVSENEDLDEYSLEDLEQDSDYTENLLKKQLDRLKDHFDDFEFKIQETKD